MENLLICPNNSSSLISKSRGGCGGVLTVQLVRIDLCWLSIPFASRIANFFQFTTCYFSFVGIFWHIQLKL